MKFFHRNCHWADSYWGSCQVVCRDGPYQPMLTGERQEGSIPAPPAITFQRRRDYLTLNSGNADSSRLGSWIRFVIITANGGRENIMPNHGSRKRDISDIRKSGHRGQARVLGAPRSTLSVADANLGQLFYALLDDQDDEDLQEVLRTSLPSRPSPLAALRAACAAGG
jgi:hypothetical protein